MWSKKGPWSFRFHVEGCGFVTLCLWGYDILILCSGFSVFCGNVSCLPGRQSLCWHWWLRSALCNCWPWHLAWPSPVVLLDWLGITLHTVVPSEFLPYSLYGHWPSEWIMNHLTFSGVGKDLLQVALWQTHWVSVHVLSQSYPWDQHFWVPSIPPKCRAKFGDLISNFPLCPSTLGCYIFSLLTSLVLDGLKGSLLLEP